MNTHIAAVKKYAAAHGIKLTEVSAVRESRLRSVRRKRKYDDIKSADMVLIFWDGESPGTKYEIDPCNESDVYIKVLA